MRSKATAIFAIVVCSAAACGGTPRGGNATHPRDVPSQAVPSEEPSESLLLEGDPAPPSEEPQVTATTCDGSMCNPCGDALCPTGFLCEEAQSSCMWLPQCGESPSCACVKQQLPDCSCNERQGQPIIRCE